MEMDITDVNLIGFPKTFVKAIQLNLNSSADVYSLDWNTFSEYGSSQISLALATDESQFEFIHVNDELIWLFQDKNLWYSFNQITSNSPSFLIPQAQEVEEIEICTLWIVQLLKTHITNLLLKFSSVQNQRLLDEEVSNRLKQLAKQNSLHQYIYSSIKDSDRTSINQIKHTTSSLKQLVLQALDNIERNTQNKNLYADINLFDKYHVTCDHLIALKGIELLMLDVLDRVVHEAKINMSSELRNHQIQLIIRLPESIFLDHYRFEEILYDKFGEEQHSTALLEKSSVPVYEEIDDDGNHTIYLNFALAEAKNSIFKDSSKNSPSTISLKGLNILITDDNDLNLMVSSKHVEDAGGNVFNFESASEAISWAKSASFDLAILDIIMPEKDGYELATELKSISQNRGENPIICLCTAYPDQIDINQLKKSGALGVIGKPFSIPELSEFISQKLNI